MFAPPTDDEGGGAYSETPTTILPLCGRAGVGKNSLHTPLPFCPPAEFGRGGNLKTKIREIKGEKNACPAHPCALPRLPLIVFYRFS